MHTLNRNLAYDACLCNLANNLLKLYDSTRVGLNSRLIGKPTEFNSKGTVDAPNSSMVAENTYTYIAC